MKAITKPIEVEHEIWDGTDESLCAITKLVDDEVRVD